MNGARTLPESSLDVAGAAVEADVRARAWRVDALCAGLLLLAGTSLCMHQFASNRWGAQPGTEDEFVYLFQAKTLAAGHLTMPSPPLPEFFEAAHLLVVPRFAAKYLPGHAALLAPFERAGFAWLAPCLLLGITAALLFAAARAAGLARWASVLAAALLLGNTDVFPFFASYLSQSSSVAAIAAVIACAVATLRRPSRGRIVALFACVVFAGLVRPFAGLAAAVTGFAVLLKLRRSVPVRTLAWSLLPLAIGGATLAYVCRSTTGSWTTPPWALYARQYMPFDGPGIGRIDAPPAERALPPHLNDLRVGFLQSRERHTFARLPSDVVYRARLVAGLLPDVAALPFAIAGLFWAPLWPASVAAGAFFLLQQTFHFRSTIYYLEMAPWIFLVAAAGAQMALAAALRLRKPLLHAACAVLGIAALWIGVHMATELRLVIAHAPERRWIYAKWAPAFEWLREQRALVFIRYPRGWDGNLDLTWNEPDLARADLVRAIDLGSHDADLLRFFPDRPAFVFDPITMRAERIR